jgi:hypothetical protein
MKTAQFWLLFGALTPSVSLAETTIATSTVASMPADAEDWTFLPVARRPFGILPSDPRDLHLGLRKNNKRELEADVAGYRSLVAWSDGNLVAHAGIEGAAYFDMRQEGSKFPLNSSDGLVGIYGEAARGEWAWQARYTHISAHIADGLFGVRAPFVYTREFLALRAAYSLGWLRPYAGYQLLTHTAPDVPRHSLELGAYAILPAHWGPAHPYLGGDLRVRGAREGTTYQLSAGAAFLSRVDVAPVRLTASYLKGHDLRGQFFEETTEKWSFGLDLDL